MFSLCSNWGMVRHKLDSVNAFARQGYDLHIICNGCSRTVRVGALDMMHELHARKLSRSIDDLEYRLKCKVCGHRGAVIMGVSNER